MNAAQPLDPHVRPADHERFGSPTDVVKSLVLAPQEKRRILFQWLLDERALLIADDEGMQGGRPSQFAQVHAALRALTR